MKKHLNAKTICFAISLKCCVPKNGKTEGEHSRLLSKTTVSNRYLW